MTSADTKLTLAVYLQRRGAVKALTRIEAEAFGLNYPQLKGWVRKSGTIEITEAMIEDLKARIARASPATASKAQRGLDGIAGALIHAEARSHQKAEIVADHVAPLGSGEFKFDLSELQSGETYVGVVKTGSIWHHIILLPAEAIGVTWQQAKTFAAAVGGELPDLGDYEVLLRNACEHFAGDDTYWSQEMWPKRAEAFYLDFSQHPYKDWDSIQAPMRARAVRRIFAAHEEVVVTGWHDRIKSAREEMGMKRNHLAKMIGVSPATITQWESGQTRTISGPNLVSACAVLNIDPSWLLGADDE